MDFQKNQIVTVDGKERKVNAVITLYELCQVEGSKEWRANGRLSKAALLAGELWFFYIPSEEGGKHVWLKMRQEEEALNATLTKLYKGTDQAPGYARKFAQSNQTAVVEYELLGKKWAIKDIGAFRVEALGGNEQMSTGDRLYFVTSRGPEGSLLFLDARHGEAVGRGGLFVGTEFNPENEIEVL